MYGISSNLNWVNSLRAFATFAVIVLHVSAPIATKFHSFQLIWFTANGFESLVRFSVPVFLMISGLLAFGKPISPSKYFKNKIIRIALPFLFWYLIYALYQTFAVFYKGIIIDFKSASDVFIFNLTHNPSPHLWFIYLIAGLYLSFPFLNHWLLNAHKNRILTFLSLWIMLTQIDYLFPNTLISSNYFKDILLYLGYPVLGYFLTHFIKPIPKSLSFSIYMIGVIITAVLTYYLSKNHNEFMERSYSFTGLNVCISAIGIFLFVKSVNITNHRFKYVIDIINAYSFGIYLSHMLSIAILSYLNISGYFIHPIIGIPFCSILCLLLSITICKGIQQIPFGNLLIGAKN